MTDCIIYSKWLKKNIVITGFPVSITSFLNYYLTVDLKKDISPLTMHHAMLQTKQELYQK